MIVASITYKNSNINSFYCYENQKDPANPDKMDPTNQSLVSTFSDSCKEIVAPFNDKNPNNRYLVGRYVV